jgi:hypothetical protein
MALQQTEYVPRYRLLMAVVAVAMLSWAVLYGIASYNYDQCSQILHAKLDVVKARIENAKNAIQQK